MLPICYQSPMACTLPESSTEPFSLPGERASAVLLHGYTGTPWEMRVVGDALSEQGIAAYGPLLPGHGGEPRELNEVRAETFLAAAHTASDARLNSATSASPRSSRAIPPYARTASESRRKTS